MRSPAFIMTAGFLLVPLVAGGGKSAGDDARTGKPLAAAPAAKEKPKAETNGCGNHGTALQFFDTPSEAAKQAKKDQKLVFVLHVSGLFEDPKLT